MAPIGSTVAPGRLTACDAIVTDGEAKYRAAREEFRRLRAEHGRARARELQTGHRELQRRTTALQALRLEVSRLVQADPLRPIVLWAPDMDGEGLVDPTATGTAASAATPSGTSPFRRRGRLEFVTCRRLCSRRRRRRRI
jgi:hypothetical protein